MEDFAERAAQNLAAIREKKPLIHNIINFVAGPFTANALLAAGASPVMAHATSEVEETVSRADALVLNIGTLTEDRMAAMIRAGERANALGKPVIFDPVGTGGSTYRSFAARKITRAIRLKVIRGNATEILALQDAEREARGVDAIDPVEHAAAAAEALADGVKTTVALTGRTDRITDGTRTLVVPHGHPMMTRITGSGCTATAIIGAFAAVDAEPVRAAATALAFFGLAGEMAGRKAHGPGSFMVELLDALYGMTPETLRAGCRIEERSAAGG